MLNIILSGYRVSQILLFLPQQWHQQFNDIILHIWSYTMYFFAEWPYMDGLQTAIGCWPSEWYMKLQHVKVAGNIRTVKRRLFTLVLISPIFKVLVQNELALVLNFSYVQSLNGTAWSPIPITHNQTSCDENVSRTNSEYEWVGPFCDYSQR